MDGELLRALYHELFDSESLAARARFRYGDAIILWIHFIAVIHDRSHLWAHDKRNWPIWCRRLPRPSYSQLMRRTKSAAFQGQVNLMNTRCRDMLSRSAEKVVDGKALTVGVYSKDPDARFGRLSNEAWACGYKLHAIVDSCGAIDAFAVTGLNSGESAVARTLVSAVDLRNTILRGDANYDAGPLYACVASAGGRLVAPRRKPGTSLGHRPHHPHRLQAIAELETQSMGATRHKRHRIRVEQAFGHLTNLSYGLAPLPNWVRRQHRVERWITAKIVLYHLHLAFKKRAQLAA